MTHGVDDARQTTIVAIATVQGRSAIGIVRLSGPQSRAIAEQLSQQSLKPRHAHYSHYLAEDNSRIDEGITLYFAAPASFTGEDVVELQTHGSMQALSLLQQRCLQLGARLARPGEFTERAFLNGKIDLSQAEAIADIIDAQSQQGLKSANESLQGEFKQTIDGLLAELIELRAYVEGALDFPEEEVDFLADESVHLRLDSIIDTLKQTIDHSKQSALLRHGIKAVLTGAPNVGKSTLINRLCGKQVAIVTSVPGTTRDRLEQQILIDGIPVLLVDTAGLRNSDDPVEQQGIQRAEQALREADIVIQVFDASTSSMPGSVEALSHSAPVIGVLNKVDCLTDPAVEQQDGLVCLSAKTGTGIDNLLAAIKTVIHTKAFTDNPHIARSRHVDALNRCLDSVLTGQRRLQTNATVELMAEDLLEAQNSLAEITGEYLPDDLLGEIFSRFCLGK